MTTTLTRSPVETAGASPVLERRTRALADTDARLLRADGDEEARRFVGHAAVFNSRTTIGNPLKWGWYEEIAEGAFDKTLAEGDARFLVDHDTRMLVSRVSAGDLRLSTDDIGLAVDADLDTELSYVRDLVRNLDKRRITGMSFGFYVVRDRWEEIEVTVTGADGKDTSATAVLRTILEVRLLEVSAVTFPAYEDTDAGLRKMADEVRAARGLPTDSPSPQGARPAPADATRDDSTTSDPAPADATRVLARQDERATALAARYSLTSRG
ncbi:HK97 family phage prohead protease [Cellulomonas sp. APG4]|uniref:HK97 family phage prohead protease n=1 Tax=Cellulomonas sp. APG4 TaxID=1538656 RepID=UPI00137A5EC0|nr:HK97 family phage prohead protease [Cellulomonas sp. APG4]NCT90247.1 HK97 family phage prohead protease [Cellulomonas sp. APG4]